MISAAAHSQPAALMAAVTMLHATGGQHHLPLFEAALAGEIELVWNLARHSRALPPLQSGRPAVVLIADDDPESTGPAGWAVRKHLRRWPAFTLIHGAAGRAWHYQLAVAKAREVGRVLIVDTASQHVDAWQSLLKDTASILKILVPAGLAHPTHHGRRNTVH